MSVSHSESQFPKRVEVTNQQESPITSYGETTGSIEATPVHEQALQQLNQLKAHLEAQRKHLETSGRSIKQLFERVQNWWKKQEQLETSVARLTIEIDHLEDRVRQASPNQITQHLEPTLQQLRQQIEKIQLASAEVRQFTKNDVEQSESEDAYPVEVAGGMKNWSGTLAEKHGKLGRYGQDCARSNPDLGIGVIADGTSSGSDSFEVARRLSRRAQAILEDIPVEQCTDVAMVETFVREQLQTLLLEIQQMPLDAMGASTLLALRYLPKFDSVVMIDIGDCEAVVVVGDYVESLKPSKIHSNHSDSIIKGQRRQRKDGKPMNTIDGNLNDRGEVLTAKDYIVENVVKFKCSDDQSAVRTYNLSSLRERFPNVPISVILASDGLQNNGRNTLEQRAKEIEVKGVQQIVAEVGTEQDDLTILKMKVPPLEELQIKRAAA